MVHHKRVTSEETNNSEEEESRDTVTATATADKKQLGMGNHPRGINRLSSNHQMSYTCLLGHQPSHFLAF